MFPDDNPPSHGRLSPSSPSAARPRSTSPTSPTTPFKSPSSPPLWARRPSFASSRRLSTRRSPYSLSSTPVPLHTRLIQGALTLSRQLIRHFQSLTPLYQLLVLLASVLLFTLAALFLIYSHRIFAYLAPVSSTLRSSPVGWVPLFLLTFFTAFPPVIGYSTAVTLTGFVYGFPLGWPIAASATVAGSTVAFLTSRGIAAGYVHRLVGRDHRFVALGQVLRRDGLGVLAMVRFCPLPYSLSNGFLATVPSVGVGGFAAATACATPKLLVHVFIGSRLALLAESGDHMSAGDRAINYASMAIGGLVGFIVGLVIYRRTMARAAEIAAEGLEEGEGAEGMLPSEDLDEESGYADGENSRLVRTGSGDVDAAALMDDDDISLWDADGLDSDANYRDAWDEEAAVSGTGRKSNSTLNGLR